MCINFLGVSTKVFYLWEFIGYCVHELLFQIFKVCGVLAHGGYFGAIHNQTFPQLCQNDAKLQTHPPSTVNVQMPNLPKIDVYNFKYKISVGNLVNFLSFTQVHKYISA